MRFLQAIPVCAGYSPASSQVLRSRWARDRPPLETRIVGRAAASAAVAVVCIGVPWLRLQTVSAIYQCAGIAFTALGLAAIGDRVRRAQKAAAGAASKARRGVGGWLSRRRNQLVKLWKSSSADSDPLRAGRGGLARPI
jgi:hypothetical protein